MVTRSERPGQLGGVGATSLGVAALRAAEHQRPDRLVADPYARLVLDAAAAGGSPWATNSPQAGAGFFALMADQVAVRTRFFDQTLLGLTRTGGAQVVLLACGMDTRAYRLDWPAGTRVFEVDFREVLTFRDRALAAYDITPRCQRIAVAADLRKDWPSALRGAGFDPTRVSAWLAEGILYALPAAACDTLLDRITGLSAPGSTLALDQLADSPLLRAARVAVSPDLVDLWQGGPGDLNGWLTSRGWHPNIRDLRDIADQYQRPVPGELAGTVTQPSRAWLGTATLNPQVPIP
ncbi:MAG: SAM-dependent methyltransferase [Mycobacterium sp.]|nr:SAM-dependent methyltransferase [Mycobacterium sp.]MBV9722470.1 SAM-dependent methyltransferase [Mycobacterium sp.]